MSFMLHPGVYANEIDLSQRVVAAASSTGGAVFSSKKGPLGPTYVTNRDGFMALYGQPDPTVSFGHDCVLDFLTQSNAIWVNRVHNGGMWAGISFHNDADTNPTTTYRRTFPTGAANSFYEGAGARQVQVIKFSTDLVTLNSISTFTIAGGGSTQTVSATVFNASSAATLTGLATKIQAALDSFGDDGVAEVITGTRNIRVISPTNVRLVISEIEVTLGSAQPTVSVNALTKLFDIFAENPGKWANDVGVKLTNIDKGTPQRQKITFSAALVASNSFAATVNGVAITPVVYATDSDTTMAAIATALQAAIGVGSSVTVINQPNSNSNDRQILVIAPNAKANVSITDLAVTGGASQATVTVVESLKRIAPNGTFKLEVYTSANVNTPVETFTVSTSIQNDGLGRQQNIAQVVNEGPGKSKYIRVYQPDEAVGSEFLTADVTTGGPIYLRGGDDGAAVTDSQIIAGWDQLKSRNKYEVRILINCGYTSIPVQQKIAALAESRRDCFAILDMPSAQQGASAAVDYRKNELNLNTSYAAIYSPDVKIADEFTDVVRFVPPSGKVAATFAYTDRTRNVWWSPAGLNRGLIRQILGLRVDYEDGDLDLMSPNQVNAIIKKGGKGYVVWDDQTLQAQASALSNINVRRLLIAIEVAVTDALDYSVFDPNDDFTRFTIVQMVNGFLGPIQRGRGLYDFLVVSDGTNNPNDLIDQGQLNVDVYLKPTLPARTIKLSTIITKTGASFQELVAMGGSTALAA